MVDLGLPEEGAVVLEVLEVLEVLGHLAVVVVVSELPEAVLDVGP